MTAEHYTATMTVADFMDELGWDGVDTLIDILFDPDIGTVTFIFEKCTPQADA